MSPTARSALSYLVLILIVVMGSRRLGWTQQSSRDAPAANPDKAGAINTSDMLRAIDALTEQNRELEKQNQRLIEQITALRKAVAGLSESERSTSAQASGSPTDAKVQVAQGTQAPATNPSSSDQSNSPQDQSYKAPEYREPDIWGEWNPGQGYKVAKTERGELNLSGYMVARYLNQLPGEQTAVDHLGRPIPVQPRQDFQFHRVMLYGSGWILNPKLKYFTFVWTVNDTAQVAVGGSLNYEISKPFWIGMGINPLPISRTVQGNHPYWPSYDRMMADEFFRPFFTQGVFGGGELPRKVFYKWMVGNNLSTLGVKATQLTRELNFGASLTWLPTTGEFGPRGALGDFENHEKLATRFGIGYGVSRENRQSNENDPANNTTIRLADSLNVFDTGALADGVTVQKVTYHLLAADAGFKKKGVWIGGEGYYRLLNNFNATGPLPVGSIRDTGFYVQGSAMIVPKLVELYAGTSYVFSDFGKPKEFLYGGNWYPGRNRNYRINVHIIHVDHSPVNSTFGFYMGQLKGPIIAIGATALY